MPIAHGSYVACMHYCLKAPATRVLHRICCSCKIARVRVNVCMRGIAVTTIVLTQLNKFQQQPLKTNRPGPKKHLHSLEQKHHLKSLPQRLRTVAAHLLHAMGQKALGAGPERTHPLHCATMPPCYHCSPAESSTPLLIYTSAPPSSPLRANPLKVSCQATVLPPPTSGLSS